VFTVEFKSETERERGEALRPGGRRGERARPRGRGVKELDREGEG